MEKLHTICTDLKEVFVATLVGLHKLSEKEAEAFWLRESGYFTRFLEGDNKIAGASDISLRNSFSEIASNFVSIQPGGRAEAFLSTRSYKAGKDANGRDVWGTACQLVIQVYGELNMRLRAGHLKHAHNPIVLYEGDTFQPRTNEAGKLVVEYSPKIPRAKEAKIFGCYVHLELEGGINDFKWMLMDDIERLRDFSNRNNSTYDEKQQGVKGKENALYGKNGEQIDPGFLAAKTLKHAMKTLPKLRLSDGVVLDEEDTIDKPATFNTEPDECPELRNCSSGETVGNCPDCKHKDGIVIPTGEQSASKTDNGLF